MAIENPVPTTGAQDKRGEIVPFPVSKERIPKKSRKRRRVIGGAVLAALGLVGVGTLADRISPEAHKLIEDTKFNVTTGAIQVLEENIPTLQRDINRLLGKETPVPLNFDKEAKSGIIKSGTNTTQINTESLPSLFAEAQTPSATNPVVLFPAILHKEGQEVGYTKEIIKGVFNRSTGQPEDMESGYTFVYPDRNTEIPVPVERAEITPGTIIINGEVHFSGIGVRFNWNGVPYSMVFVSKRDIRDLEPLDVLIDPATGKLKDKITLSGGTPFMRTGLANATISVILIKHPTMASEPRDPRTRYSSFDFITSQENGGVKVGISPAKLPK